MYNRMVKFVIILYSAEHVEALIKNNQITSALIRFR